MRVWLLGIALGLASVPWGIAAAAGKEPVHIDDVDEYLAHQRVLRRDVEHGKRFAHVDEQSKRDLLSAQDRVFAILEDHDSLEELTDQQRVDLYNAQNTINGVVADAELERQVCRREKHIGSNRVKLVCLSKREWREVYENTQRDLRAPRTCQPTSGPLGSAGADPCNQGGGG
jgi:hypothetical protein